jgi:hypothetical protein
VVEMSEQKEKNQQKQPQLPQAAATKQELLRERAVELEPHLQRIELTDEEFEQVGKKETTFTKLITGKLGGMPNFSDYALEWMGYNTDMYAVFKVIGDDKAIYLLL